MRSSSYESSFALVANAGLVVTGRITGGEISHFIEANEDNGGPIWYVDLTLKVGRVLGGYDALLFSDGDTIPIGTAAFSQEAADELVARQSGPALLVLRAVGDIIPTWALTLGRDFKAVSKPPEWLRGRYTVVSSEGVFTMTSEGGAMAPALEAYYGSGAVSHGDDDFVDPVMVEVRSLRFDQLVGLVVDYWSHRYAGTTPVEWTDTALAKCADISYRP